MDTEISKIIHENVQRIRNERIQKVAEELIKMESQEPKRYYLDITTVKTFDDIKEILNGLDLAIYSDDPNFPIYKKYFTIESTEK